MDNTKSLRKPFGKTGLTVPSIIYGTSFMGNLYQELPEEVKLQIMQQWFEVSESTPMIDCAGKYGAGLALEVIGAGLKKLGVDKDPIDGVGGARPYGPTNIRATRGIGVVEGQTIIT